MTHEKIVDLNYIHRFFSTATQEGADIFYKTKYTVDSILSPPNTVPLYQIYEHPNLYFGLHPNVPDSQPLP